MRAECQDKLGKQHRESGIMGTEVAQNPSIWAIGDGGHASNYLLITDLLGTEVVFGTFSILLWGRRLKLNLNKTYRNTI
jgi:hypothetical protein